MINIQNIDDNECLKWCLVRYLQTEDHDPARIRKVDPDCARKLGFKGMKFLVQIRDSCKVEKRTVSALVLLAMEIEENIQCIYRKIC